MANKLADAAEVLLRHIHPNFYQKGVPSSQKFMPSEKDNGLMSLDRASLATAAESHARYTKSGLKSVAVFGVSVGEFGSEKIECVEDAIKDHPTIADNPAHSLADYTPHEASKQKVIAKRLQALAVKRGCLFETEQA